MDKETIKSIDTLSIKKIIDERVGTNLGQIQGTKCGFGECADITTTVGTLLVANAIVEAGFGDTKQAVREFAERLKQALFVNCTIIRRKDDPIEEDMKSEEVSDTIDLLLVEVTGE